MEFANNTKWHLEVSVVDLQKGEIKKEIGVVNSGEIAELEVTTYLGEMGGGKCSLIHEGSLRFIEDTGENEDIEEMFIINPENHVTVGLSKTGSLALQVACA